MLVAHSVQMSHDRIQPSRLSLLHYLELSRNRDSWKFILDRVAKRACPLLNAQFDLLEVILLKTATEVALSILPLVLIEFENTKFSMFAAI